MLLNINTDFPSEQPIKRHTAPFYNDQLKLSQTDQIILMPLSGLSWRWQR